MRGGGAPVAVRGARWAPQATLLHSRLVSALAREQCNYASKRTRAGAEPHSTGATQEAKVGRSSDDAQRALLRLIQPANRVREPRVFGE